MGAILWFNIIGSWDLIFWIKGITERIIVVKGFSDGWLGRFVCCKGQAPILHPSLDQETTGAHKASSWDMYIKKSIKYP